jgi:DNA-binding beta-propeller fold protein YncE
MNASKKETLMTRLRAIWILMAALFVPSFAMAQQLPTDETAPLVLVRVIPIPGVLGRFDHMAVDNGGGRVFAAVYGNDSVEVIDTARGTRARSIQEGFIKPQMVSYVPDMNRIVVASEGDGTCKVFDADTYKLIDTVKYSDDADQLRYDPAAKRVYVGYGDEAESAIGIFDATTNKKIGEDFKLGAHPESFQLEEKGPKIFVNLASISQIAVIDRNTRKIDKWKLQSAGTNFPMALDEPHRRLFVAARKPARLLVLDMDTGKEVASLPGAIDTDDLSWDPDRKRIYVTSGEGYIFVYQQIDANRYQRIAKIPTAIGARTGAYTGQVGKHNSFYLAVPARADRGPELWVYETRD